MAPDREPSLSEVHADLVGRLAQDERLRHLEQDMAAIKLLPSEMRRMEDRLVAAIQANGPRSPWPAVSAIVAAIGLVLVLAAAIYSR